MCMSLGRLCLREEALKGLLCALRGTCRMTLASTDNIAKVTSPTPVA